VLRSITSRLTSSNVVAFVALFVALGGGAYAAIKLPANSVGTKQLKNGAVTSAKVKNGSLGVSNLSSSARASLRGSRGPTGPTGPTGATGPKGDLGPAGTARAYGYVDAANKLTRSKNVVKVQENGPGVYCVQLDPSIDATTAVAVASVDFRADTTTSGPTGFKAAVEWDTGPTNANCMVPNVVAFETFQLSGGLNVAHHDEAFSFIVG
jgi:hypothetical protein